MRRRRSDAPWPLLGPYRGLQELSSERPPPEPQMCADDVLEEIHRVAASTPWPIKQVLLHPKNYNQIIHQLSHCYITPPGFSYLPPPTIPFGFSKMILQTGVGPVEVKSEPNTQKGKIIVVVVES